MTGMSVRFPRAFVDRDMLRQLPGTAWLIGEGGRARVLVHEGAERDAVADRRLGCSLAAVAGAVNAAGFLAVGYYSANMTGNVSTLATALHAGHVALLMSCIGLIDQREALMLVGAQELSYEEAAVICGVSAGTIKSRVSRARSFLVSLRDGAED